MVNVESLALHLTPCLVRVASRSTIRRSATPTPAPAANKNGDQSPGSARVSIPPSDPALPQRERAPWPILHPVGRADNSCRRWPARWRFNSFSCQTAADQLSSPLGSRIGSNCPAGFSMRISLAGRCADSQREHDHAATVGRQAFAVASPPFSKSSPSVQQHHEFAPAVLFHRVIGLLQCHGRCPCPGWEWFFHPPPSARFFKRVVVQSERALQKCAARKRDQSRHTRPRPCVRTKSEIASFARVAAGWAGHPWTTCCKGNCPAQRPRLRPAISTCSISIHPIAAARAPVPAKAQCRSAVTKPFLNRRRVGLCEAAPVRR